MSRRGGRPRLLQVPREVSAATMMVVSGLGGLFLSSSPPEAWILGLIVLLVHLLTFDAGFYSIRSNNPRLLGLVVVINAAPYPVAIIATSPPFRALVALGAALLVLGVYLLVVRLYGPGTEMEYIYGSAVPVLPAITLPAMLGTINLAVIAYWLLLTIYAVATAAYIESRLFRVYVTFDEV